MTNKRKYLAIIMVIVIAVIIVICVREKNNIEKSNQTNETMTMEEINKGIIRNIKQKLEENGLILEQEKKAFLKSTQTEGYSYVINTKDNYNDKQLSYKSEEDEEDRVYIYKINLIEKKLLFGSDVKDGAITLDESDSKYKGILYNNILVLNCKDKQIENVIIETLKNI